MPTPKIKFKLIKLERALVFQVLEQDERFRKLSHGPMLKFHSEGRFAIYSNMYPLLTGNDIFLHGDMLGQNLCPSYRTFQTNEARDEYFNNVIAALRDWSQNAPQFAEDKAITPTAEPDTYSF